MVFQLPEKRSLRASEPRSGTPAAILVDGRWRCVRASAGDPPGFTPLSSHVREKENLYRRQQVSP